MICRVCDNRNSFANIFAFPIFNFCKCSEDIFVRFSGGSTRDASPDGRGDAAERDQNRRNDRCPRSGKRIDAYRQEVRVRDAVNELIRKSAQGFPREENQQ